MNELSRLLGYSVYQRAVMMSEYIDGDAAQKIQILSAIDIPDISSVSMIQNNPIPVEYRKIIFPVLRKNLLVCFLHVYPAPVLSAQPVCRFPWK